MLRSIVASALAILLVIAVAEAAKRGPRIKGTGETLALKAFQKKHGLSDARRRELLAGIGRIRCPWGVGTAFLLGGSDVFVTSGHIFIEVDEKSMQPGGRRGSSKLCSYFPLLGNGRYQIAAGSLLLGASSSHHVGQAYRTDWAVGRLDRPVEGGQAFLPGSLNLKRGDPVIAVSQGMNDFITRICAGEINETDEQPHPLNWSKRSLAAFTTDCDTGPGSSGGPVLSGTVASPAAPTAIGLTLGWIGDPAKSAHHVALPVERDVVLAVARSMRDPLRVLDLARFYKDAAGPPAQMLEIARGLYLIAASGGRTEGYYWLGALHFNPWGILPNDEIAAYGWFVLAVTNLASTDPLLREAQAKRDVLAARLGPGDRDRASGIVQASLAGIVQATPVAAPQVASRAVRAAKPRPARARAGARRLAREAPRRTGSTRR